MKAPARNLLALAVAAAVLLCASARAELLYATNGTSIVQFDSSAPTLITSSSAFTGLTAGETIVDFDLRPANGLLYGIGSSSRIYIINPMTGAATAVGAAGTFTLNGTAFGVDFNPVPDRIRLVSNTEQNLRLNPDTAALTPDGNLNPAGNVVSVAYTNNFAGATSTALYSIDSASGTLGLISVPNNGGPINTVGSLGLGTNLDERIGFDISGLSGTAFASITTGGLSRLYTINLATGAASLVGNIGTGATPYLGLTAATAVPEPSSVMLMIGGSAALAFFARKRRRQS